MFSVSVIVPWQPGCPHREASWRWLQSRFADDIPADWQIVIANYKGVPFSKSRAIRAAVPKTNGDILIIHDSDLWVPNLVEMTSRVRSKTDYGVPHTMVHRLTPEATERVLSGSDPLDLMIQTVEPPYRGVVTGGIVIMRRDLFKQCPLDRRFVGWGGEDEAWAHALKIWTGCNPIRGSAPLIHLWHPPAERINRAVGSFENAALLRSYQRARTKKTLQAVMAGDR